MPPPAAHQVAIACQGGGSLTAFTAGVLQVLLRRLDASRWRIVGLSGTSGGAMCAAIAWYGLLIGRPRRGAALLERFWRRNAASLPTDALLNEWLVWSAQLSGYVALPQTSPYSVPEYGKDQLRTLLEEHIPFAELPRLVTPDSPQLLVGAVNEQSGAFKVFCGKRLTAQKLLASAALPTLFRAVRIDEGGDDDGLYWDGLFSQNPPIRDFVRSEPLADNKPDEIWLIRINPVRSEHEPTSVAQIELRRNGLAGNLSLRQEIDFIDKVNQWVANGWLPAQRFKPIRVREIALDGPIEPASKLDRSPGFISELMQRGRRQAARWLEALRIE